MAVIGKLLERRNRLILTYYTEKAITAKVLLDDFLVQYSQPRSIERQLEIIPNPPRPNTSFISSECCNRNKTLCFTRQPYNLEGFIDHPAAACLVTTTAHRTKSWLQVCDSYTRAILWVLASYQLWSVRVMLSESRLETGGRSAGWRMSSPRVKTQQQIRAECTVCASWNVA